jgi:CheY-like chemotaxis protein
MNNKNIHSFYLPALIKISNLDIRKAANKNPTLLVKDYFNLLLKLIKDSMGIISSLQKIIELKEKDIDIQTLEDKKILFTDIGCYNLVSSIDDIIKYSRRGYKKYSAEHAEKFLNIFNKLIEQLSAAKKAEEVIDDNTLFLQESNILSKMLKLLEYEDSTRKLRILAVDDAPSTIKSISSLLDNDYKVYGITNPTMVEKFLQQITPDLFLLDYEMPELSGFDLVPIIRSFEDHKDTPIIFLTSSGTVNHVSAAYTLGACDFIVKPFDDTILREKIAKHIVRKKLF